MSILSWLTLVGVCFIGAMSPGPSLAVILQNRVQRGPGGALVASWAHAAGIFFWALAASTTLGTLFKRLPAVKTLLTLAGAAFLIYLAFKSWNSAGGAEDSKSTRLPAAWLSGLSISFLNPKVFVFFTALFSQLIPAKAGASTLIGMAMVAALIDGTWYSFVSLLVGRIGLDKTLNRHGTLLNRVAATIYLLVACFSLVPAAAGLRGIAF